MTRDEWVLWLCIYTFLMVTISSILNLRSIYNWRKK